MKKIQIIWFCFLAAFFLSQPIQAEETRLAPFESGSSKERFAPNQVIVVFKEGQTPRDMDEALARRQTLKESLAGRAQVFFDDLAARLQNEPTVEEKLARLNEVTRGYALSLEKRVFSEIKLLEDDSRLNRFLLYQTSQKIEVEEALDRFRSLSFVESAQPNYVWTMAYPAPTDPYFTYQWPLAKLQTLSAWDKTRGSNAVTTAIIDSGLDSTHPDFAGRAIVSGYDFTTCNLFNDEGYCVSPKSRDANPMDDFGHGSMVTGLVAAATNNGAGIAGLDWYGKIMPLKAMVETGGYVSDIVDAIVYAVDHGAKVINLSLGAPVACTAAEQEAINYAYSHGVIVVAAAGNENANAANTTPASCQHVIAVAATDQYDARAPYSNYGAVVDLAAPGGNAVPCGSYPTQECMLANYILGTGLSPDFFFSVGTSFAAPHVTGAVALLLALNPALTPDQVEAKIKAGVDPVQTEVTKPIGTGRLNLDKILSPTTAWVQGRVRSYEPAEWYWRAGDCSGCSNCHLAESLTITCVKGGVSNIPSWHCNETGAAYSNFGNTLMKEGDNVSCTLSGLPSGYRCVNPPGCSRTGILTANNNDWWFDIARPTPTPTPTRKPTPTPTKKPTPTPTRTPTPTPTQPPKAADINLDEQVNLTDFRLVLRAWGTIGTTTYNYREDIYKDGRVNARDLAVVVAGYGR